ncbi:ComEA family DNA-binding protein [Aquimarina sediminis]|uniref:ComEA family DNA-binding protein n=1 Tax=Aquimarina sediminis TaxID=2070536 RepID=UPI000CA01B91|nr:helix-hairpin-helix domain-containing protein [Aquimarina sediminis]
MRYKKSHFEVHSRFRNGIFLLSIILFVVILGYYFSTNSTNSEGDFVELAIFQRQVDSLKELTEQENKKYVLKPFNPNFISDYKGYRLGLSAKELDRLYEYRKSGRWINSNADFKKVTQVSDSLLSLISPLFKFPEWTQKKVTGKKHSKKKYFYKSFSQKKDLNLVSVKELQEEVGIPGFIANRIIRYRSKIGGYVSDIQLKDIIGLYENQRNKILSLFTVKTPKKIKKVSVNSATVNELLEVPYFDFEMVLDIKDFIEKEGDITNFNELGKIDSFSLEKIDRIKLYLTLN